MVSCLRSRGCIAAASIAALAALAFARGDESVPMKDVPEAVRATATQRFGALDTCKASKEKEHGKLRWEIEHPVEGGALESIVVGNGGELMTVEKPIAADKLPKAVRDALALAFPKATIATAETLEEHSLEIVVMVDGKKKHVKVELDGAIPVAHAAAKAAEAKEHAAKDAAAKKSSEEDEDDDDDDEGGGN